MKKLLFLPIITLLIGSAGFTTKIKNVLPKDETSKRIDTGQSYYFTENLPDSFLKPTESMFSLTFYASSMSAPITGEIKLSYNGINKTVKADKNGKVKLNVAPGKYRFQFYYNANYGEIYTDFISVKPGMRTDLDIYFRIANEVICDKPVIYVYPRDTQEISIHLDLKGEIGFTYPYYDIGWNFIADPDGTIHMNDKKYHYLFWDGTTVIENNSIDWNEGFIVERDSLVSFFEEKLKFMGLNSKEAEDYITYWCPRMVVNDENYIHFMFNEEYNEYAGLEVSPAPDKMFRVFMLWSKAEENRNTQVIPQVIESFEREGFTVVEWGGAEMQGIPVIFDAQVSN